MARIRRRVGIDIPGFRGVNKQDDPAGIGLDQFQDDINTVHTGKVLRDRPGLSKIHTTPLEGAVMALMDPTLRGTSEGESELMNTAGAGDCTPVVGHGSAGSRIFFSGNDSCNGNPCIYHYAPDQDPRIQKIAFPAALLNPLGVYYSDGATLDIGTIAGSAEADYKVDRLKVHRLLPRHGGRPPTTILRWDTVNLGGRLGYTEMMDFQGERYYVNNPQDGNPLAGQLTMKVYRLDKGVALLEDDTKVITGASAGSKARGYLIPYREELLNAISVLGPTAPYSEPYGTVWRHRVGGVWSDLALPAGVSTFKPAGGVVLGDVAYIVGAGRVPASSTKVGPVILSYAGVSLALAHHNLSAVADRFGFLHPVLFNGFVYYFDDYTAGTIGRTDGSVYTDAHKDLDSQLGGGVTVIDIIPFRGKLHALIIHGSNFKVMASPGTNTAGTWTTEASVVAFSGFAPAAVL